MGTLQGGGVGLISNHREGVSRLTCVSDHKFLSTLTKHHMKRRSSPVILQKLEL